MYIAHLSGQFVVPSKMSETEIYFCGSIRAGRDDVDLYAKIVDKLAAFGKVFYLLPVKLALVPPQTMPPPPHKKYRICDPKLVPLTKLPLYFSVKGPFINCVTQFWPFFDPSPSMTFCKSKSTPHYKLHTFTRCFLY